MSSRRDMTLVVGVGCLMIFGAAGLFFVDVVGRGWAVAPHETMPPPDGWIGSIGRTVAADMTPIFWIAWLPVLYGVAALLGQRQCLRRMSVCFVSSVAIWLVFDGYNFGFIHAWDYHGLARNPVHRYLSFFLAFGAICPAMFLTANVLLSAGLAGLAGPRVRLGPRGRTALVAIGFACSVFPLLVARPVGALTLWPAFLLLLDPINERAGAPSVLGDLRAGRWGRPVALVAAAFLCGLLWEFWNFWATAKWTYDLPFLGPIEDARYFEMPVVGLLGYLPFGLECWAMFQTVSLLLRRAGFLRIGPLPETSAL